MIQLEIKKKLNKIRGSDNLDYKGVVADSIQFQVDKVVVSGTFDDVD